MAEIKIQRKERHAPWMWVVLALLLALALFVVLRTLGDRTGAVLEPALQTALAAYGPLFRAA